MPGDNSGSEIIAADFSFLKNSLKEEVSIVCHDKPDPDCLASALGLKSIIEKIGLKPTIYWGNEIPHTQNRVMMNVLNISSVKLDKDDENFDVIKGNLLNSHVILLDTSCICSGNNMSLYDFVPKGFMPDMIIDHHIPNASYDGNYVNRQYGACSTIIYKILIENNVDISEEVATALYIGISIDTDELKSEGTTKHDEEAYQKLKNLIDPDRYLKIFNYPKPFGLINLRKRFYNTCCTEGASLIIADVGIINPQQQSLMAELCEEMLNIESIDTSVVLGIVDEGYKKPKSIIASFRSKTLSIDSNDFIQKVFLKKDGKKNVAASGGGRKGAGRAEIKMDQVGCECLDFLATIEDDKESKLESYLKTIFDSFRKRIKEEREKI